MDEVRAVAAGLSALGVGRGDTVALMMANRMEFYPLEVAAQHLGATAFSVYNTGSSSHDLLQPLTLMIRSTGAPELDLPSTQPDGKPITHHER